MHVIPRGSVSGLSSRPVQVLWSDSRGSTPNLHPLTNQGGHSRASLSYCGILEEDRVDNVLGNGLDSGMLLVSVPFACFLAESTAD
jgi:hypothetical protein